MIKMKWWGKKVLWNRHRLHHHSTPFLQGKYLFSKPPTCHPEALLANFLPSMRNAQCPQKRRCWGTFPEGWRVLTWLQSRGWQEAVEHCAAPSLQTHLEHRPRLQPSPSWNTWPSKEQGSKGQENKKEVYFPMPFHPFLSPIVKTQLLCISEFQTAVCQSRFKRATIAPLSKGLWVKSSGCTIPTGTLQEKAPNSWRSISGTCSPRAQQIPEVSFPISISKMRTY